MKRIIFLVAIIAASACTHKTVLVKTPPGQVKKSSAPGQVKKETGSQSAKPYAPGQQKKKN